MMRHVLLIAASLLLSACGYIPFSSGKLEGTSTSVPADWTSVAQAKIVQLETNPASPYSVKLWVVGIGPALYVHAGANRATWVEHIEDDANVRLLISGAIYNLRAVRVTDSEEFNTFSDAYETKYGNRPRNEAVDEAYLFRLSARL